MFTIDGHTHWRRDPGFVSVRFISRTRTGTVDREELFKRPDVQAQVDAVRQEIVVGTYINEWMRKNPVADADIQKEYDRVKGQAGDKEYKARHILVKSEDLAKTILADLKKGTKFEIGRAHV